MLMSLADIDYVVKEKEGWGYFGGAGISISMSIKNNNAVDIEKGPWD